MHMITFRHHSRFLSFRRPQGAVPCSDSVHIEAEIGGDPSARVQLRLYNQFGVESFFDLAVSGGRARGDIRMPEVPCLVWYYFIIRTGDGRKQYYGADSGEGWEVAHGLIISLAYEWRPSFCWFRGRRTGTFHALEYGELPCVMNSKCG